MEEDLARNLSATQPGRSLSVLEDLLAAARAQGDAEGEALVLERMAQARFGLGDLQAADELYRQAGEAALRAEGASVVARCRQGRADVAAARGKPGEAAELYAEAAEAMVALGDENGELACRSGACGCLAALSELDEARAGYQATLARAIELGRHAVASDCHAGLGEIAEEVGDPTGAAVRYREAAQAAAAAGDEMRRANSLGRLAGALVACRQYGEAADCAAAAAEVHEAMGIEDLTALDRWILADALLGLDRKREALAELVRAGDLFRRVGAVEDVAGISEQIDRVTEELRPEST